MEKFLKLKGDKKLEVKFTPRSMARFQAETGLGMGFFMHKMALFEKFKDAEKMSTEDQATLLNALGFEDLKKMLLGGCPAVETLEQADGLIDELVEGLYQSAIILAGEFSLFLEGNLMQVPGVAEKINPTPKPKPKKPTPEAVKKAE